MNGAFTYGPKGRLISVMAVISIVIGALQASNVLTLLPPNYAKIVGLGVVFVGAIVTGCSERIQGGASKREVRIAAQESDNKNAAENPTNKDDDEEIELDEINR